MSAIQMNAVKLGGVESTETNAVELGGMEAKQNSDDIDLARLGKNPVLKVWRPNMSILPKYFYILLLIQRTAKFWLHVHFGLQLHGTHHLGRVSDVRS